MKVVLKKDVARIGRRHEIKEVPDGLARNRLIPQGLVVAATPQHIAEAKRTLQHRTDKKEAVHASFRDALQKLKGQTLQISATANKSGNLFKGIHEGDIATLIKEKVGPFNTDDVVLNAPIKTVGVHTVALCHGPQKGTVTIEVTAK